MSDRGDSEVDSVRAVASDSRKIQIAVHTVEQRNGKRPCLSISRTAIYSIIVPTVCTPSFETRKMKPHPARIDAEDEGIAARLGRIPQRSQG